MSLLSTPTSCPSVLGFDSGLLGEMGVLPPRGDGPAGSVSQLLGRHTMGTCLLGTCQLSVDSGGGGTLLYPVALGPKGFWKRETLLYPNFRKSSESPGLSLFPRTLPCTPWGLKSGPPQHPTPQPSLRPPAPPPRALSLPSPARPGRCFSPAKPSPTRVAACSGELIPAGRGTRLPGPAARLSERAPATLPRAPARAPPAVRERPPGPPRAAPRTPARRPP